MALRALALAAAAVAAAAQTLPPASNLVVEYVADPIVLDVPAPRFSWTVSAADPAARGVVQGSYRVQVTYRAPGGGAAAQMWDSGVVASAQTTNVAYAGTALFPDSLFSWTVVWTDGAGNSAPAANGTFGTGLLTQAAWAPAAWIGCPLRTAGGPNFNQLRAEFDLAAPAGVTVVQARAYIAAVGYYSLRVNGAWASQGAGRPRPILDPGWTTYEVTSLYNAYDVTDALVPSGPNAFAIHLGNGWPDIDPVPGNSSALAAAAATGAPDADALVAARLAGALTTRSADGNSGASRQARMVVSVRTSDGKTTTWTTTAASFAAGARGGAARAAAGGWQCGAGALLFDNIYDGCTYDARLETTGWDSPGYTYSSGTWTPALLRADPGGAKPTTMLAQLAPAIVAVAELPARAMWSPAPGVYVFDFEQNLSGYLRLRLTSPVPRGLNITMRHAESVQHPPYGPKDGNLYYGNLRSAKATDVYTTAGATGPEGEVFEPMFTYHGFRYAELSGLPFAPELDTVTAVHIRSGVPEAGNLAFPPTANVLNQFQHAAQWVIGNNLMSVISDCDQRDERKGWMGDSGLSMVPITYNYGMGAMYTAWAANMRDSQTWGGDSHPAGSLPDTVPHTFGSYPSDPAWGTAYPAVVYTTWRFYGDTKIAADHYPNLQAYVAFMTARTNASGVGKIYQSYGDWCPPPAQLNGGQGPKPPSGYTSGVAFLVDLQRITEIATALGRTADAAAYASYRAWVISGFNSAWRVGDGSSYGNANGDGRQTANAAALALGAAAAAGNAPAVAAALVNDIVSAHGGFASVGIIGMRWLHTALVEAGSGKLAVDLMLQTDYPSYGWEFNHPDEPATTLWELLDGPTEGPGMNSRAHHMFSSPGGWLFEDVAGLGQARAASPSYDPADPSAHGFRHAVIFPRVTDHPALPFAQGEYDSVAGRFAVAWANANASAGGGTCVADAPENAPVHFACPAGGTITGVAFASFGTPTGSCGAGFSRSSCDAANSSAIVRAACVGQSACDVDVSTTVFGDPCYDVVKHLDAQVTCSSGGVAVTLAVTVPANAKATVRVPFSSAGAAPGTVTVTEGGAPVWAAGAYVPGVPGVTGASVGPAADTPVGQFTIDVEVGSGDYAFAGATR